MKYFVVPAVLSLVCIMVHSVRADDAAALAVLEQHGSVIKRDELAAEKRVESISMNVGDLTDESIQALRDIEFLPALNFLGFGGTELSQQALVALQHKPSLRRLSLSYTKITDDGARALATLHSLEALDFLSQIEISQFALYEIFRLTSLKELTLSDRLVDDELLSQLHRFPQLKALTIRSVFVTDKGLMSVRHLTQLQSLHIFLGAEVTDRGVRQLEEMDLRDLEITYLNVTDAKLKSLRKIGGLKSLRFINASNVTDEGIPYLLELTELKKLDIADAKITNAGIRELRSSLPTCSVAYLGKKRD